MVSGGEFAELGDAVGPGTFIAPILRSKQRLNSFRMKGEEHFFFCFLCVGFLRKVSCRNVCFRGPRDWHLSSQRQRHAIRPEKQVALRDLATFLAKKRRSFFQQRNEMTTKRKSEKTWVFLILLGETFGVFFWQQNFNCAVFLATFEGHGHLYLLHPRENCLHIGWAKA